MTSETATCCKTCLSSGNLNFREASVGIITTFPQLKNKGCRCHRFRTAPALLCAHLTFFNCLVHRLVGRNDFGSGRATERELVWPEHGSGGAEMEMEELARALRVTNPEESMRRLSEVRECRGEKGYIPVEWMLSYRRDRAGHRVDEGRKADFSTV